MSIHPRIPVVTAGEARDLDARTIATLPDSYTLMHRAAQAAADWLAGREWRSAAVYVGGGNNGGDGWVIAGLLRALGWSVRVHVAADPRTPDAQRARADAERAGPFDAPRGDEAVLIDALLGTGSAGAPRGAIADALARLRSAAARTDGTTPVVIAIDLPTGLDATTGEDCGAVAAACTLTFASIKRGQLLRRDLTGALHVLDIGAPSSLHDDVRIVDAAAVQAWLPTMPADAWKGTRGRLAIVGGGAGMAGAAILAARGAHASGVGMVRCDVAKESALALQIAAPFATVAALRASDWREIDTQWPHAFVIGPGIDGTSAIVREQVLALLHASAAPVVLDAGALTAFRATAGDDAENLDDVHDDAHPHLLALRRALRGRPALLTPHVGEFTSLVTTHPDARGSGQVIESALARFDDPLTLARTLNATVLLKGVPTVIASPDGTRVVSATGNAALAMGGTGDILAGIAGALMSQGMSALHAGAAAAWVHGTAAEHASMLHGGWRGVTMDLLLREVTNVWPRLVAHRFPPHTLLELPVLPCR
ncbi:MAG TPA: NAD(P)H-hydrate dehydratase [Gemmatimonadaceae bacterium]|nr:NAD(P)H-hydrate dehydratase [Gemmatimonadaceae bacterium]